MDPRNKEAHRAIGAIAERFIVEVDRTNFHIVGIRQDEVELLMCIAEARSRLMEYLTKTDSARF